MNFSIRYLSIIFSLHWLIISVSSASVVFSTLSQPVLSSGVTVGEDIPDTYEIADKFIPTETLSLTSAVVMVRWETGSQPLVAHVWSDVEGSPSIVLDTSYVNPSTMPMGRTQVIFTFSGSIKLSANTAYWFSMTSTNGTNYVWTSSKIATFPERYRKNMGAWQGPSSPMSAFEINGMPFVEPTPTPQPPSTPQPPPVLQPSPVLVASKSTAPFGNWWLIVPVAAVILLVASWVFARMKRK